MDLNKLQIISSAECVMHALFFLYDIPAIEEFTYVLYEWILRKKIKASNPTFKK